MDTPQDNEVANEPVEDAPDTDETADQSPTVDETSNESIDDTPKIEEFPPDDDDFLAGIDTDGELNLSVLPERTSPPAKKSPPPEETASQPKKQSNYRGLLILTILLVLIPVLGGFALWQMNNNNMQAEINRLEATINAQSADIDAQVATRVAAAVEQAQANTPKEVPVEVVEVVVTATPLPATDTPVPVDTPTSEPTDSPAADLALPTATASPATAAAPTQDTTNNTAETITVSNITEPKNPVTMPIGETVFFQDNFDSNSKGWFTGQKAHPYARDVSEIVDGSYRRSIVSTREDVFKETSPTFTARNFVISTEATLLESSGYSGIGLTFREDSNGNYYLAKFSTDGTVELVLLNNGQWQTIASQSGIALIPGEVNSFAVVANGAYITLYFNSQPILTTTDNALGSAGKVGLALATSAPNQIVVVDFDNLLVTDAP